MAYPDCISPQQVVDLANRDVNRLVGEVAKFTIQSSPYMASISKGTAPNVSTIVRSVAAERALPAASLVRPGFINDALLCGTAGGVDQVGSTEFQWQIQGLRGRGPQICLRTTRTAWPGSYAALVNSLKQGLIDIVNSDIRATYLDLGGSKMTIASTQPFENIFAGAINAVGTQFPNYAPDAPVSFRSLEIAATLMRETFMSEPYDGEGRSGNALYIAGMNQIQLIRDELDIREDIRYLTAGRYQAGKDTITGYEFEGPYRGIKFGVDPTPLRANTLDGNGQPIFVEPFIATNVTVGVGARPNPAWATAQYEVSFLMFKDSFRRMTPEEYSTPGFDFSQVISNQGLKFKQLNDASCNLFEDFGLHIYEIVRGFKPEKPQNVLAILAKRCTSDTGLIACGA